MFEKLCAIGVAVRNLWKRDVPSLKGLELWRVSIPEAELHQEWQICDRYQGFSTEIVRLSALGIAGIGFLYEHALKNTGDNLGAKVAAGAAAVLFALSVATALIHRFYSTDAMSCQIRYLRIRKRLKERELSEPLGSNLQKEAENEGARWRSRLADSAVWLGLAALLLGLAAAALSSCFAFLIAK